MLGVKAIRFFKEKGMFIKHDFNTVMKINDHDRKIQWR